MAMNNDHDDQTAVPIRMVQNEGTTTPERTTHHDEAAEPNCKGCSASVHITPDEIAKLFGETLRIREVKLTTEREYERRMAACRSCDAFLYGTTCSWCGCLMAVKAKLAAAHCPAPQGSRW